MSGTLRTKVEGEFNFEGLGSVVFKDGKFTALDIDGNHIIGPLSSNREEIIEYIKWLAECVNFNINPIQFRPDKTIIRERTPWGPYIQPLSPYVYDESKIPVEERPIITMNSGN